MSSIGNKTAFKSMFPSIIIPVHLVIFLLDLMIFESVALGNERRLPVAGQSINGDEQYVLNQALLRALEARISHKLLGETLVRNLERQFWLQKQYNKQHSREEPPARRSDNQASQRRAGVLRCVPKNFRPPSLSLLNQQVPSGGGGGNQQQLNEHRHKPESQVKLNHSDIVQQHGGPDSPKIIYLPPMADEEEEEDGAGEAFHEPLPVDYGEFQPDEQPDYEEVPGSEEPDQLEGVEPEAENEQQQQKQPPVYTDDDQSSKNPEPSDNKETSESNQQTTRLGSKIIKNSSRFLNPTGKGGKRLPSGGKSKTLIWRRLKRPKWAGGRQLNNSIPIGGRPSAREKILMGAGSSGNFTRSKRQVEENYDEPTGGGANESPEGGSKPEGGGGTENEAGGGGEKRDEGEVVGTETVNVGETRQKPASTEEPPLEEDEAELPHVGTSSADEPTAGSELSPRESPLDSVVGLVSGLFSGGIGGGGLQFGSLFGTIVSTLVGIGTQLVDMIVRTASSEIPRQLFSLIQTVTGVVTSLLGFGSRGLLRDNGDVETMLAPLKSMQDSLTNNMKQRSSAKKTSDAKKTGEKIKRIEEKFAKLKQSIKKYAEMRAGGSSSSSSSSGRKSKGGKAGGKKKGEKGSQSSAGNAQEVNDQNFVDNVNNLTESSVRRRSLEPSEPIKLPAASGVEKGAKKRAKRSLPAPLRTLLVYGPFSKFYMTMMLHRLVRQQSSFLAQAVMAELVRRFVVPSLIGSVGSGSSSGSGNNGPVPLTQAFNQLKQAILGAGSSGLIASGSTTSETVSVAQPSSNLAPKTDLHQTNQYSASSQRANLQRTSAYDSSNDCQLVESAEGLDGLSDDQASSGGLEEEPVQEQAPMASAPTKPAASSLTLSSVQPMQQALQALTQGNLLSQYMKDPAITANSKAISLKIPNTQTTLTVPNLINGEHSLYGLMTKMLQATTTMANQHYQQQAQQPQLPAPVHPANSFEQMGHLPFGLQQPGPFPFDLAALAQRNRSKPMGLEDLSQLDMGQLLKQAQSAGGSEYPHLLAPTIEKPNGLMSSEGFPPDLGKTEQELLLNNILMSDSNDKHEISQGGKSYVESALKGAPEAELLQLFSKLNQQQQQQQQQQQNGLEGARSASLLQSDRSLPLSADSLAHNILNKTLELSLANYLNGGANSPQQLQPFGKDMAQFNEFLGRNRPEANPSALVRDTSELLSKSFAQLIRGLDFDTTKAELRAPSGSEISEMNVSRPISAQQELSTNKPKASISQSFEESVEMRKQLPTANSTSTTKQESPLQIILNTDSALALVDKLMSHHKQLATSSSGQQQNRTDNAGRELHSNGPSSSSERPPASDTLLQATPVANLSRQREGEAEEEEKEEVIGGEPLPGAPEAGKTPTADRLAGRGPPNVPLGQPDYNPRRPVLYRDDLEESESEEEKTGKGGRGASSRNKPATVLRNTIGQVKQMPTGLTRHFSGPPLTSVAKGRELIQVAGPNSRAITASGGNSTNATAGSRLPAAYERRPEPPARQTGNMYTAAARNLQHPRFEGSKRLDSSPVQQQLQTAASSVSNQTAIQSQPTPSPIPSLPRGEPASPRPALERGGLTDSGNFSQTSSAYANFDFAGQRAPINISPPVQHRGGPAPQSPSRTDDNKNALNNLAMALNVMNMVLLNQKLANGSSAGGLLVPASSQQPSPPPAPPITRLAGRKPKGKILVKGVAKGKASAGKQARPKAEAPQNSRAKKPSKKVPPSPPPPPMKVASEGPEAGSMEPSRQPVVKMLAPSVGSAAATVATEQAAVSASADGKNHRTSTNTIRLNSTLLLASSRENNSKRLNVSAPSYLFQPLPVAVGQMNEESGRPISAAAATSGSAGAGKAPEALDEPEREHATRWNDVLQHISVNVR